MRPMYNTSFFIPLVLTVKLHGIALSKSVDFGSKIDVVCDQDRLTGRQPDDESLMPATVVVVGQELDDNTFAGDLQVAFMVCKCIGDGCIGRAGALF